MSFSTLLKNATQKSLLDFQSLIYGKVLKFDKGKYTADIQPLKNIEYVSEAGNKTVKMAKMYDIPINIIGGSGFSIKTEFKKGDIVLIALAVSEIDVRGLETTTKENFLSKSNAVILGSLGNTVDNAAIEITNTKIIMKAGLTEFTIDASGATVTVGGISVNLLTHLHGTGVGPSTPPTPNT